MTKKPSATVESLQRLGFSEYEARAYIALVRRSPMTGYELAKEAGIPRPNVYPVIDKLAERGAVLMQESSSGTRYAAVAPRQLMERVGKAHERLLDSTISSLEALETPAEPESVLTARGYSALLEHARSAIHNAKSDVLIALWPNEARLLQSDVAEAEARNVRVTMLCMYACANDCGACHGKAYRYRIAPLQNQRWLIVVADAASMVAGEITNDDAQAVVTNQRLVVELAAAYVKHGIALAALVEDLGPRLDATLKPSTQAILNALSPQGEKGSFIDYLRRLMSEAPNN